MSRPKYLTKREQQIMELIYERKNLTASDAMEHLPGNPSNSTVRTLLRILETKGAIVHREEEGRFVYEAAEPVKSAARQALTGVIRTFFNGSVEDVVATLLSEEKLDEAELDRLQKMIDESRRGGSD